MMWRKRFAANYWRKKCLRYDASPDDVVYDEDPESAAKLLRRHGYIQIGQTPQGTPVAGYIPRCWRKLEVKNSSRTLRSGLLFLHERESERRMTQLVAVSYSFLQAHQTPVLLDPSKADRFGGIRVPPQLHVLLYDLGDWTRAPRCQSADVIPGIAEGDPYDVSKSVRFFAGQYDPKDKSRFTIGYEVDGERGELKWRLVDLAEGDMPARLGRTILEFEREGPGR